MSDTDYARIAPYYDTVTGFFLRGSRKKIVRYCLSAGVRRVLDIGCGTGRLVRMLREHGLWAVGVDSSLPMVRQASAPGWFLVGDAAHLPVSGGVFDLSCLCLLLHETDAAPAHLLDIALQVAPQALVLDWHLPENTRESLYGLWPHCIERWAGAGHYRQFRQFLRQGGIGGLAQKTGAQVLFSDSVCGGALRMTLLGKAGQGTGLESERESPVLSPSLKPG